jgi:hypothetical protein
VVRGVVEGPHVVSPKEMTAMVESTENRDKTSRHKEAKQKPDWKETWGFTEKVLAVVLGVSAFLGLMSHVPTFPESLP